MGSGNLNVLILTSLFFPEIAANAKKMTHLAEELAKRGDNVHVITAFPYYSTSKDFNKYRRKWLVKDEYRGIRVIRTYAYPCRKYSNLFERLLSFLSFMFSSIFGVFSVKGKIDVVVAISPPVFTLFSAVVISKIKRAALCLDIQDIYPATLVSLGFLKNKAAIKLLEMAEKFFYKNARGIAALSEGFKIDFMEKGVSGAKIEVIPNWADTDVFKPLQNNGLCRHYGLDGKFVVMFIGTMGYAQALETLIKTVVILKDYSDKINFVLLGEGVEKETLKRLAAEEGLSNVMFLPPCENEEVPAFLSMADACLVHLRKNKLYEITIPCKTYEYMAMGKPIIMGASGDAGKTIETGKCGIVVEPENPDEMAKAVLRMYMNSGETAEMGRNARKYAMDNFSREKVLSNYVNFLKRRVSR